MLQLNPEGRNPLYPDAMRLSDADIGVNFLTFSISSGSFWLTTLSSASRIECDFGSSNEFIEESHIAARDSQGGDVDLSFCGIHPGHYGWNPDHFSVVVTHDNLRNLYAWVCENRYLQAAEKLARLYPERMLS